jgi:DNA modification methylase
MICDIKNDDCTKYLEEYQGIDIDLTFLDPPFNQSKDYRSHNDNMTPRKYWDWMSEVCNIVFQKSSQGAAIYFMQREKNAQYVLDALATSGWTFQNLIIWKKKTSAVPSKIRYGKHYQIIAFATKGSAPRVFNKLRIDPPLLVTDKYQRPNGIFVTDVWDDIRELTSGYFAGDEPLRYETGERVHKQQSPVDLLARIILSSTNVGDLVFDPFAGTGTTLIVAKQLHRNSIGVEIDSKNFNFVRKRIECPRPTDDIKGMYSYYRFTEKLEELWPISDHDYVLDQAPNQLKIF